MPAAGADAQAAGLLQSCAGERQDVAEVGVVLEAAGTGLRRQHLPAHPAVRLPLAPGRTEEAVVLDRQDGAAAGRGPGQRLGVHQVVDVDHVGAHLVGQRVEVQGPGRVRASRPGTTRTRARVEADPSSTPTASQLSWRGPSASITPRRCA